MNIVNLEGKCGNSITKFASILTDTNLLASRPTKSAITNARTRMHTASLMTYLPHSYTLFRLLFSSSLASNSPLNKMTVTTKFTYQNQHKNCEVL